MEDFIYHRPVLESEVVELLQPKPGSLIVDATCGGGGHTEAFLESGANVLALDRDPDAVQHVSEQLARFGRRVAVLQANYCGTIGVEYMHINDLEERRFIQDRIEGKDKLKGGPGKQ